jgi:protein N-terminal methyltransferase
MGCFWSDPFSSPCEIDPEEAFKYFGSTYYDAGIRHWSEKDASLSGMLDGYLETNGPDIDFSRAVLKRYLHDHNLIPDSCADVGCGIGRISISILSKHFRHITLVEPVAKFLRKAEAEVARTGVSVRAIECGAQDWQIDEDFDCIWLQWVCMFLTDEDVIDLLRRCRQHLRPNGIVVLKDNMILSRNRSEAIWYPHDHSISRSVFHVKDLIIQSGLKVHSNKQQTVWNNDFIPLYCFVLTA